MRQNVDWADVLITFILGTVLSVMLVMVAWAVGAILFVSPWYIKLLSALSFSVGAYFGYLAYKGEF